MEDRDSNDIETAARLEQHQAIPWPLDDEPDEAFHCAHCDKMLLPSEGYLCGSCDEE